MGRRPCCSKEGLNRGAWTAMEDKQLADYVATHGEGKWRDLPHKAGLMRCGKSCRLRWLNYLRPGIKRGNISDDEAELIVRLHKLLGNRWSLIAGRLPGRTDNEIKNYWNTNLRKKQHHHHYTNNNPQAGGAPQNSTAADHPPPSKPVANNNITTPTDHDIDGRDDHLANSPSSSKAIRTKASRCSGKAVMFLPASPEATIPPRITPPSGNHIISDDGSNYNDHLGVDTSDDNGLLSGCDLEIDEELLSHLLQSTDFSWLIDDDLTINDEDHHESPRDGGERSRLSHQTVDTIPSDDHGDRIDRTVAATSSTQLQTCLIAIDVAATCTDHENAQTWSDHHR